MFVWVCVCVCVCMCVRVCHVVCALACVRLIISHQLCLFLKCTAHSISVLTSTVQAVFCQPTMAFPFPFNYHCSDWFPLTTTAHSISVFNFTVQVARQQSLSTELLEEQRQLRQQCTSLRQQAEEAGSEQQAAQREVAQARSSLQQVG